MRNPFLFLILSVILSGCFQQNRVAFKINKGAITESGPSLENNVYELHSQLRMPDSEMTSGFERFSVPHFSGDGSRLFVGAHTEWHSSFAEPGSVFVFDYNENLDKWTQTGIIRHPVPANYHKMGFAIASSQDGKTLFTAGEFTRAVLVFKEASGVWTNTQTITLSVPFEQFGMTLKLSPDGQTLIIASIKSVESITNQGAIYIYKYNALTQSYEEFQKFTEIDALNTTTFLGTSIGVDKNFETIAVSSHRETITHTLQGRVYIYQKDPSTGLYVKSQSLEKAATHNSLTFGRHVELSKSGKYLAIAHSLVANTFVEGGVSVYTRNANGQYILSQEISAPAEVVHPTANTNWGLRLNFNSDESQLLVTSNNCYINQVATGCFEIYKNVSGTFTSYKRFFPRISNNASFGSPADISFDSKFYAIGAPGQSLRKGGSGTSYSSSGTIYVYKSREPVESTLTELVKPNRYLPLRKDDLIVYGSLETLSFEEIFPGLTELFTNGTIVSFGGRDVLSVAATSSVKVDGTTMSGPITMGFSYYATAATNAAVLCSNAQFEIRIANSNQLEIRLFDAGRATVTAWMTDPSAFQLNQWNNFLVSLDWDISNTPKIYLNGDILFLYRTTVASPTLAPMPDSISLGSYLNTNTHAGRIKDLLIWQGTMTPSEAFLFKSFY